MSCKKENIEDYVYEITTSRALSPFYNVIGINEGDDVTMSIPINNSDWIGVGYNVTIYDKVDRTTFVSVSADADPETVIIDDYGFGTTKAVVVIEDRSDINNIETVETIGYIFFKQFKGGGTATTQEGTFSFLRRDDSTIEIPYYTTSFE